MVTAAVLNGNFTIVNQYHSDLFMVPSSEGPLAVQLPSNNFNTSQFVVQVQSVKIGNEVKTTISAGGLFLAVQSKALAVDGDKVVFGALGDLYLPNSVLNAYPDDNINVDGVFRLFIHKDKDRLQIITKYKNPTDASNGAAIPDLVVQKEIVVTTAESSEEYGMGLWEFQGSTI